MAFADLRFSRLDKHYMEPSDDEITLRKMLYFVKGMGTTSGIKKWGCRDARVALRSHPIILNIQYILYISTVINNDNLFAQLSRGSCSFLDLFNASINCKVILPKLKG
jgi:hypothetical protein